MIAYVSKTISANSYTPVNGINKSVQTLNAVIYPNPSKGNFNVSVSLNSTSNVMVTVFDLTGKAISVNTENFNAGINTMTINNNTMAPGMYLVQIQTEEGTTTQKIEIK